MRTKYKVTLACPDGSHPVLVLWADSPQHAMKKATRQIEGAAVQGVEEQECSMPKETMTPMRAIAIVDDLVGSTDGDAIEAWQCLINSGLAWTLPGRYGRQAAAMIAEGVCYSPMAGENPKDKDPAS